MGASRKAKPLTAEQQRLVEANEFLAYCILGRFTRRYPNARDLLGEDLRSEALFFLIKAAQGFRARRGYKFSTYAVPCIWRGMRRLMMREQREASNVDMTSEDIEPPNRPGYAPLDLELWDRLDALLRFLDPRLRDVFKLRFFDGRPYSEIGKRFGVTKQRAKQLASDAFDRLKRLGTSGGFGGRMDAPGRLAA